MASSTGALLMPSGFVCLGKALQCFYMIEFGQLKRPKFCYKERVGLLLLTAI